MDDNLIDGFTDKQVKFCQEYVVDYNGAKAAIRAGYSEDTARVIASNLLSKVNIKDYINELQTDAANSLQLTKDKILRAYTALAFYDSRKFYDEEGNLIPINQLDDQTAFALAGFEVQELFAGLGGPIGNTKKIKLSDRRGALDGIAKMLGYNAAEKKELTGPNGSPLQIESNHKIVIEDFTDGDYSPEEPGD
ncbi:MAG: terminase small subunit [Bacteroidota bacterium]